MPDKKLTYHAHQGDPRGTVHSLRIVVVDDNPDSVVSLILLLRDEGHQVRGLHSAERVIQVVEDFQADVVILDLAMPGETGWELARRIRRRFGRSPVLIALSAAYRQGAARVLAQLSGFDHYLTKPYHPDALLSLLAPLRLPRHAQ